MISFMIITVIFLFTIVFKYILLLPFFVKLNCSNIDRKYCFENFFLYFVVGVGGFVINDGKLLVVKEKYRKTDHWKLPGGMVDHSK